MAKSENTEGLNMKGARLVPIFTLNSRDNFMLEMLREQFKLSPQQVREEIKTAHTNLQQILANKGIDYMSLRAALVPQADRHEAGFIFDSRKCSSSWYGREVAEQFLPLLEKRATQSVMWGDLIAGDQVMIREILEETLVSARALEFVHGTALYCVYVSNLSDAVLQKLHTGLSSYPAYVGYVPTTYASYAKTFLSTTLMHGFLKNKDQIIQGHEDDRENSEDVNMVGFPFEEAGYQVRSLQSMYFDLFLAYKIDRPVFDGFEVDNEFALNAVSNEVLLLRDFSVVVEDAKHAYLQREKEGKLRKAGIQELDRDELALMIQNKIDASYIYNMLFMEEHHVVKFNLMLEVSRVGGHPTKLVASLEYQPEEKVLRLITLH